MLVRECEDYIRLTLKSAELLDSERLALRNQISAERNALIDTKLEIRLIAKHAASTTRHIIEKVLVPREAEIREEILRAFNSESSLFPKPLASVQGQYLRLLQSYRDRLSERAMAIYGVLLRTTEPEIIPKPPRIPDVKIGRVFDHNWELLSPIIPMSLMRAAVLRRFRRKIADETFKNLSRLTTQWDEIVRSALSEAQREAERRLEDLIATVEKLTSATGQEAPRIRVDLEQLQAIASTIAMEQ